MKHFAVAFALTLASAAGVAHAKGQAPEDLLKGKIIISESRLPMKWNSVGAYVAEMKRLNKSTIWFDKKTGKVKVEFIAFFAQPVNDVQVNLVIADVTPGFEHKAPTVTEQFMNRGDRVLINSITLDKEDFDMNRKYRFTVVDPRKKVIASTEFTLRGEGPHYSGKVEFSEEEAKKKD